MAPIDRFNDPLYTPGEVASFLGIPVSTLSRWASGYRNRHEGRPDTVGEAVLTRIRPPGTRGAAIPFIGLAEGHTLLAIRATGVPLQRIRPALERLDKEMGLKHALASERLYTDGAEVLFDVAANSRDVATLEAVRELVVVRNGQRVLNEVVESYLRRVTFEAGYAKAIRLPRYDTAEVLVDPGRSFGQPVFARGGARLRDALGMFDAGESLAVVAEEYGMPIEHLEDAVRVAARTAA